MTYRFLIKVERIDNAPADQRYRASCSTLSIYSGTARDAVRHLFDQLRSFYQADAAEFIVQ